MIRTGVVAVALVAALAFSGQGHANGLTPVQGDGAMQYPVSGAMLDGTDWRAVLVGASRLSADDGVTIAFAEGRVSGRSGCNRFTGGYEAETLDGGAVAAALAFGPLAGTRMACPGRGDEVEAMVLPALEAVDGFLLDASGRLLLLSGAEVVLVALPADPA